MKPSAWVTMVTATFTLLAGSASWKPGADSMDEWPPTLPKRPEGAQGLHARFFGTTTVLISDGTTSLMVDGFFSRPGRVPVLLGKIEPDEERIRDTLCRVGVRRLDAVLVAHSHYDHAFDSARVAEITGARLVGSRSTAQIACGHGLPPERVDVVRAGSVLCFQSFEVAVFETPHSPKPRAPGTITEPLRPPARYHAYRMGESFSFLVNHRDAAILVVPAANYCPGMFAGVRADVVLLSIGRLGKQSETFAREYWRETVTRTGAKTVVPVHWDDFTRPLRLPLRPLPWFADDVGQAMRWICPLAKADGVDLRLMPVFDDVELPPRRAAAQEPAPCDATSSDVALAPRDARCGEGSGEV